MSKKTIETHNVEILGRFALFTRPETQSSPVSSRIPTAEALRGMMKCILHRDSIFPVPIRVVLLPYVDDIFKDPVTGQPYVSKDIETYCMSQYMLENKTRGKWFGSPANHVYLHRNHYKVTFKVEATVPQHAELRRRLTYGIWDSHPYLGQRECGAIIRLWPEGKEETPLQVSFLEPLVRLGVGGKAVNFLVRNGCFVFDYAQTRAALAKTRWGRQDIRDDLAREQDEEDDRDDDGEDETCR